jgi:hypothetical protein
MYRICPENDAINVPDLSYTSRGYPALLGITNRETCFAALFSDIRKRNFIIVTVKA